nr:MULTISPECIES: AHH domain-containing protein [Pseudomonas]
MPGIEGFQKHHIIPQQLVDHPVLKASGMNIHSLNNIIYLPTHEEFHPTRTIHRGSHPGYSRDVKASLNEVEKLVVRRNGRKPNIRQLLMISLAIIVRGCAKVK